MNKKIIAAALMFVVSAMAHAGKPGTEPPQPEQATGYLGHTTETYDGSTDMRGLYLACQEDYGEGSKVCTTQQLMESPSIANATIATGMWVRPYVVAGGGNSNRQFVTDYTGKTVSNSSTAVSPSFPTCNGTTAGTGVIVTSSFLVNFGSCASYLPAACCR